MCIAGDAFADMAREINKNPAFIAGCEWMLNHQWISVEEALPEEYEDKFVLYCGEYPATASYDSESKQWYWGSHIILGVTHWMPIPSLEGGKK